jgi:outer membrane protein assembly factor BamB
MNHAKNMVFLFLAAVVLTSCSPQAFGEWNTYQGNSSHTGYVPGALDPSYFGLLWQRTNLGNKLSPPVIGGGKVFVSNDGYFTGGALTAFDAATGATSWSINPFGSPFSINPPAYANGKVYIQTCNHSSDTYMHAFDANSGGLAYRAAFAAQWERYYSPTPFSNDVYINGGYYGGAYGFSGQTGAQRWFTTLPQYDEWTPAVDSDFVYSYVGEYSPALYVLNRSTGSLAYSISDPNFDWNGWSMNLAPVLGGNNDVLAIHNGRLISFDLASRSIGWELSRNFSGQPTVAGGVIYAIDSNTLTAWDQRTAALLWSWAAPDGRPVQGTMVATDSHIFVGTSTDTYAISLLSHTSDWSFNAVGSLALDNGVLYISGSNGWLTAIGVPEPNAGILLMVIVGSTCAWRINRRTNHRGTKQAQSKGAQLV